MIHSSLEPVENSLRKSIYYKMMRKISPASSLSTRVSSQYKLSFARPSSTAEISGYAHLTLATLLGAVLISASVGCFADDTHQQLRVIQANIAAKEKIVKEQKQQRGTLLAQLQDQEKEIAAASIELRDTQAVLTGLNKEIASVSTAIDKLLKQQKAQENILAQQLDAAFRMGQHKGVQLILNGDESMRSQRILTYYGYFNQARQNSIENLKQTRNDLATQRNILQGKQAQQKKLLATQQQQQQRLEQARVSRQQTLTALESSLHKDEQSLNELRANETRLREKITAAESAARNRDDQEAREVASVRAKEQAAKRSGSTYKPTESERELMSRSGGLGRPAGQHIWPVRGDVLHRFGEHLQGELRWKGIVISAHEGSEVHAIADGRVLLADWLQGYGLVVVIDHGQGDMSLYGYNQNALVSVGNQVKAGQAIASVGASGGQGQPSLYFEIRRQGRAVNPQVWLGK
jgi:septal ring factor EnvC (AmiA/AmiB activator)